MIALIFALSAFAQELADPAHVRREISGGVWVDWTDLAIEVTTDARGHGTQDIEAVEQQARREVDAAMGQGARRVLLNRQTTVGDLEEDQRLWQALASRLSRWEIEEGRYTDEGEVTLTATLDLQDLLKPYTLSQARPAPVADARAGAWTGLVIDARGTGLEPCWAPAVVTAEAREVMVVRMWEDDAVNSAPLVYVSDPAHPFAARAGLHPLFVRAAAADGASIVLGGEDLRRLEAELAGSTAFGQGRVVIVVDP